MSFKNLIEEKTGEEVKVKNDNSSTVLTGQSSVPSESELEESLELLIERDNPMAEAAEKALQRL